MREWPPGDGDDRVVSVKLNISVLSPVSTELRGSAMIFVEMWHPSTTLSQPSTKNHPEFISSGCPTPCHSKALWIGSTSARWL
jgi:hypothetical protein